MSNFDDEKNSQTNKMWRFSLPKIRNMNMDKDSSSTQSTPDSSSSRTDDRFDRDFPSYAESMPDEWKNPDGIYDRKYRMHWTNPFDYWRYLGYQTNLLVDYFTQPWFPINSWELFGGLDTTTADGRRRANQQAQQRRYRELEYQRQLRVARLDEAFAKDKTRLQARKNVCNSWYSTQIESLQNYYTRDKRIIPGIDERAETYPDWWIENPEKYSNLPVTKNLCETLDCKSDIATNAQVYQAGREQQYQSHYRDQFNQCVETYEAIRIRTKEISAQLEECSEQYSTLQLEYEELINEQRYRRLPAPMPECKEPEPCPSPKPCPPKIPSEDSSPEQIGIFCKNFNKFNQGYITRCKPFLKNNPIELFYLPIDLIRANSSFWQGDPPLLIVRTTTSLVVFILYVMLLAIVIIILRHVLIPTLQFSGIQLKKTFDSLSNLLIDILTPNNQDEKQSENQVEETKPKGKSWYRGLMFWVSDDAKSTSMQANSINRGGAFLQETFTSNTIPLPLGEELEFITTINTNKTSPFVNFQVKKFQKSGKRKRILKALAFLQFAISTRVPTRNQNLDFDSVPSCVERTMGIDYCEYASISEEANILEKSRIQ